MTNSVSSSVGRTLLRYHVAGALPCAVAPLPCENCAPSFVSLGSCTSLGSVLVLVLRVRLRISLCSTLVCAVTSCSGSWSCLGHPQPPWRTRHGCTVVGCKPGPTRVLPMPRQYGIGRRAPALRTLATSYDFKETWFIGSEEKNCYHVCRVSALCPAREV